MEYRIPQNVMDNVERARIEDGNEIAGRIVSSLARSAQPVTQNRLPDPIEYLEQVMQERGIRKRDLKIYIGSSGYVSSVLNRKKPLSLKMIRNLHDYLGIPAEILIQPYDCH